MMKPTCASAPHGREACFDSSMPEIVPMPEPSRSSRRTASVAPHSRRVSHLGTFSLLLAGFGLVISGLIACSSPAGKEEASQGAEMEGIATAAGVENPGVEVPPASRAVKRLTIDMLAASIPVVAGRDAQGRPITWTLRIGNRQVDALDALSTTLGKPDFIEVTEENTEPSALYLKFMGDMAVNVCTKILDADEGRTNPEERVLVRFASLDETGRSATIDENLRYLELRFLGRRVAPDDEEAIAHLRDVFETASRSSPREGWLAVCVALLSAPEFHLY